MEGGGQVTASIDGGGWSSGKAGSVPNAGLTLPLTRGGDSKGSMLSLEPSDCGDRK